MTTRETQLKAIKADIVKGLSTAKKLAEFRGEVDTLEARLISLSEVLPEDKDGADLLRQHAGRGHAVESDDHELQAWRDVTQAASRRVADRVGAGRHLPQPGDVLRSGGQVHPHCQHQRPRGQRKGSSGRSDSTITARCTATTFVLLEKPAAASKAGGRGAPQRAQPGRGAART